MSKRPAGGWNLQRVTTHPGEMLREEFLKPMSLSVNRLALDLHVPVSRIDDLVHERRGITADTALRLSLYFGMSAEFWMNLQSSYDLSKVKVEKLETLRSEVRPRPAA
ncbi:MAG: HigA family addiction module antidote protein [Acidobacteria bacterium]|nr:HigA family addiction module antidote protein [Acidobacteriaceae bacterium]MBV9223841.1 HigA family addiction module antidote protein [Acidobacteriaceae bacterium]MBV9482703.1 HigA family addiction module antidote protein [Acidobacteriota bacterium]